MTQPPNPPNPITLWDWLRSNLRDPHTQQQLTRLETAMATAAEQIDNLSQKVDGVTTVTADILADFRAFRDAVLADRENLTDAGQAALDRANAKLDEATTRLSELDVEVGDADGSDTPPAAEEPPVEEPPGDDGVFRTR